MEQEQKDIFQNGMEWLRADFHLHTIRDREFKYTGNPHEFFNQFLGRLKDEGIGIGIITNHNKFDKDEFSNLRRAARKEGIWMVPGVELSVNDGANGVHCLVVFDDKTWLRNEDYINQFLSAAFEGTPNRENGNANCNYNLTVLLEKLEDHRHDGRDSFVVFAHADNDNGFFHELEGGRIGVLAKTDLFKKSVLAIQKVRNYGKINTYKYWFGGTLPALVEGSDCKSIDEVGKASLHDGKEKKTFIKIGDFSFEALKYALLDHDNRVRSEMPVTENSYIKSICFEGGKLNGRTIHFSPELNSLIGIRGSGKSAIIELVRYALDISLSYSAADSGYKNNLISYVLGSGGKIVITVVDKHGKEFRIEKIYGQKENIFDENNEWRDCSIDAVFDTPVYFGQKDLSNKNDGFKYELLNRLAGTKTKGIRASIAEKKREITNIILEIQKDSDIEELREETTKEIKDSEQKLSYFREKGVETKLKRQLQVDADLSTLKQNRKVFENFIFKLQEIIRDYDDFFSRELTGTEENKDIFVKANTALKKAKAEFEKWKQMNSFMISVLAEYDTALHDLENKDREMQEDVAQIKRELNSDSLNPDDFLSLSKKINLSRMKLQGIEEKKSVQIKLREKLLSELSALNNLWHDEYSTLQNEADKINKSGGALHIKIDFKKQRAKFLEKLKTVFKGTGIRETTFTQLSDNFLDFIEIYREQENLSSFINENQIGAFRKRFDECLGELLTYRVEDEVTITYKDKTLDKHSLGQRASALILFLLAQKDTDVLIIDQPEDDLDNQTIYDEVIKELLKLKGKMQFIFATHNANIPVLGDSEKVVACSFDEPEAIKLDSGTIDQFDIQQAIVSIMEGGAEAFAKRKDIYNLWETEKKV